MGKKKAGQSAESLASTPIDFTPEFDGLLGFEEIKSCTLLKFDKTKGKVKREVWKNGKIVKEKKQKKKKKKQAEAKQTEEVSEKNKIEKSEDASEKKKVKKKKKKKVIKTNTNSNVENLDLDAAEEIGESSENHTDSKLETPPILEEVGNQSKEDDVKKTSRRKRKKKGGLAPAKTKKARYDKASYHGTNQTEEKEVDVSSWLSIYTPEPVIEAIAKLGFSEPTEIQKLTIPPAIKGRMDIIGAAETGSGKTLAFGIPIIHGILLDKGREADGNDSGLESSDDEEGIEYGKLPAMGMNVEEIENKEENDMNVMDETEIEGFDVPIGENAIEVLDPSSFDFEGNDMGDREKEVELEDEIGDEDEDEDEDEDDEEEDDEDDDEDDNDNDSEDNVSIDEEGVEVLDPSALYLNGENLEDSDEEEDEPKELDFETEEGIQEPFEFPDEVESFENDSEIEADEGDDEEMENQGFGCVRVIKDVKFDFLNEDKIQKYPRRKLRALIITPTRELAVQINSHLLAVLVNTDIKTAVVVGGMSSQKQERVLARGPDIVIGTPGRLWELLQQGNHHLCQLPYIRYLAIDETDRMVERGHFQELTKLLEVINSEESAKEKRQTFVFSATLTMIHKLPKRMNFKKKVVQMTSEIKIENLVRMIGIKKNRKVVDVTRTFGTAESLTEAKIFCDKEEKDYYLYYLLKQYPGRTLVFCNSIDCVRRLNNLFSILQCQPQPLHASMQQKQRLKSLERFSSNPRALLLATDVAARGLDIPNIQHVIHYQVPRTAETYVHRSGRTARATQEGLSVLFIDSSEISKYHQLCRTLNRETELPPFPTDIHIMKQVRERVNFARNLEKKEHTTRKQNVEEDWWKKMAKESMLDLDEEEYDEDFDREKKMKAARNKREINAMRAQMTQMLKKPLLSSNFSSRYPTQSGTLVNPFQSAQDLENSVGSVRTNNKAINLVKKESKDFSKLVKTVKIKPPLSRTSKKKMKGFEKRKLRREQEKKRFLKEREAERRGEM
nr:ATP-dependent RNA helicase DDX24-like [Penaeus vannamei]XP_027234841.1 ATP-dependent RNA helicase DDX24-like [Penaeus vannamei]XP_027234910.1 ATP-dependent RNA helicase DDX24-like [Penaeus vannamei]